MCVPEQMPRSYSHTGAFMHARAWQWVATARTRRQRVEKMVRKCETYCVWGLKELNTPARPREHGIEACFKRRALAPVLRPR